MVFMRGVAIPVSYQTTFTFAEVTRTITTWRYEGNACQASPPQSTRVLKKFWASHANFYCGHYFFANGLAVARQPLNSHKSAYGSSWECN